MLCRYIYEAQKKPTEDNQDDHEQEEVPTYEDYVQKYCTNYIRAFFNHHMDDSWFRQSYSPLELQRIQLQERSRASQEAKSIRDALVQSSQYFCQRVRLGGGHKGKTLHDKEPTNTLPTSHVLSSQYLERVIAITKVPPYVTDEQLKRALLEVVSLPNLQLSSSQVDVSSATRKYLHRSVYLVCETPAQRLQVLFALGQLHQKQQNHPNADKEEEDGTTHVPRRHDAELPKEIEWAVSCADAYGRLDVDGDGKGGEGGGGGPLPLVRMAHVLISTQPVGTPPIQVLSAALSTTSRISRDKQSALMLARALDVSRNIPVEHRLDEALEQCVAIESESDVLDVAIAYLRRVHLFSFYNGCCAASQVGHVLAGQHASSTIHLRLEHADELLEKEEETAGPDLLVQRLDDNIGRALEESNEWVAKATSIVDETRDALAAEIEALEETKKKEWKMAHAIVDEDGRARCSFHFCRKLFKDDKFLAKHLLKKHGEYLCAEMAKCHDSFMMKAWDESEQRPVPPILVDCGSTFGMVPSPVTGAQPVAADPEPDLWQREKARRAAAAEREKVRRPRDDYHRPPEHMEEGGGDEPKSRGGGFVDVDDMKEEKVELSFENVEVVSPPPKKKRKRKKLL